MKRYCIAKIIGDGTENNPYRSAIQKYNDLHYEFGGIAQDPITGQPTHTFVLAILKTVNISRLMADQDIDIFPDFPLDGKMSAMQTATKNKMVNALAKYGVSISGADGFRDAIRTIGQMIQPDFDENNFDLSE